MFQAEAMKLQLHIWASFVFDMIGHADHMVFCGESLQVRLHVLSRRV